jgi:hypothetical protein
VSYLDLPRIHLAGKFFANPSTINNTDANYDPSSSIYPSWNPRGLALWKLDVSVQTALGADGKPVEAPDTAVGAQLTAIASPNFAKLVDLDPDMQSISQVFGLTVQMTAATEPGGTPAVLFTGTVDPCALTDLWMMRVVGSPRPLYDAGASGAYQSVIRVKWGDTSGSPLLQALRADSPDLLSIKWVVDGYNGNFQSPGFGWGRMVATLGPASADEPAHFIPGRRLDVPASAPSKNGMPLTLLWFGQGQMKKRGGENVLVLDLGNSVAVQTTPAGPPVAFPGPIVISAVAPTGASKDLGTVQLTLDAYQRQAGIFELPLDEGQANAAAEWPIRLQATPTLKGYAAELRERMDGRLVQVDQAWARLDPGVPQTQTLYALRFGQPDAGAGVTLIPLQGQDPVAAFEVGVVPPPPGGNPPGGQDVTFNVDANGTAQLQLTGGDTQNVRPYIDGQVYFLYPDCWSPWLCSPQYGPLYPMISALVFGPFPRPASPTWDDVSGILMQFARLYPGMRDIMDISDYATVRANQGAMIEVFSLPVEHPNYMPVTRDLSTAKRDTLLAWLNAGCPPGASGGTATTSAAVEAGSAAVPASQAGEPSGPPSGTPA